MYYRLLFIALLGGCSVYTTSYDCVISSGTYVQTSQQLSGDCGQLPNVLVDIDANGVVSFPSNIACQTQDRNSCSIDVSDCSFAHNGVSCSEQFTMTFDQDGNASGDLSLSCDSTVSSSIGAGHCTSTYSFTMTKE